MHGGTCDIAPDRTRARAQITWRRANIWSCSVTASPWRNC